MKNQLIFLKLYLQEKHKKSGRHDGSQRLVDGYSVTHLSRSIHASESVEFPVLNQIVRFTVRCRPRLAPLL